MSDDPTYSHPTSGEPDKVETRIELDVPSGQAPVRLDVYLTEKTPNATRTKVQRAVKAGRVSINGTVVTRASTPVQPNDHIACLVMKAPPIEVVPEAIPLDIVYEDDVLLVVDKPAGMVAHPAYGHRSGTLVNALLHHVGGATLASEDIEGADDDAVGLAVATAGPQFEGDVTIRPGLVHRLDKDTTGLMVVAKTDHAAAALGAQFAERSIRRRYLALVWGTPDPTDGRVETWLGRDPRDRRRIAVRPVGEGKWAATTWETVEPFAYLSLLRFRLETGRTHQIRVHAQHLGHPIFGDPAYGGDRIVYGSPMGSRKSFFGNLFKALPHQALHAHTLGFRHPVTGEAMDFRASVHEAMAHVIERVRTIDR